MSIKEFFTNNRKPLLIGGGVCAAAVVAAVAVFFFLFGGKDAYVNVIPKDAFMMTRVDLKALIYDNDIKLDELLDKSKMDAEDFKNSGINFAHPVYVFSSPDISVGLVAKISDRKQATNFIEENLKKMSFKSKSMDDDEGLSYAADHRQCVCIDDDKLLLVEFAYGDGNWDEKGSDAFDETSKLMKQDKEKSVYDKAIYDEILKAKKSVACNIDFDKMPESATSQIKKLDDNDGVKMLLDSHILFSFDIKDNTATLATDIFPQTEKAQSIIDKYQSKMKNIDGKLIGYGPANPILWGIANVDGKELADNLKDENMLKDFGFPENFDLSSILTSFNGDLAFGVSAPKSANDIPTFMVCSQVKNDDAVTEVKKLMNNANGQYTFQEKDGELTFYANNNYYSYNSSSWANDYSSSDDYATADALDAADSVAVDPDYDSSYDETTPSYDEPSSQQPSFDASKPLCRFGCSDKTLYLTNGDASELLKDNAKAFDAVKQQITESSVFAFLDFKALVKTLKKFAKEQNNTMYSTVSKYLDDFDSLVLRNTTSTHIECVLSTKDNKKISDVINGWI